MEPFYYHILKQLRICSRREAAIALLFAVTVFIAVSSPAAAVTLPFTDGFESGDFRAWNGGRTVGFSVLPADAHSGQYSARGTSSLGIGTDYYQEALFGDHPRSQDTPVTAGLYVKFSHKFDTGFDLGRTADYHKVLLINFEDGNDLRREQIILNVFATTTNASERGQYMIENIHWNADRSFGSGRLYRQNRGSPLAYRQGQWDTLKIFIRPNTVGQTDGVLRVWINGEIKIEHTDISIRLTTYNPNLVIIGSYAPATDIQGTRWWDDVTISRTDPDASDRIAPNPPTQLRPQ